MFSGALVALLLSPFLAGAPSQIWFGPLDPIARQTNVANGIIPSPLACCSDFWDLFAPGAQWTQAADHVSVFKLSSSLQGFPDSDLRQLFSFLRQHKIDLAIEFGPLLPSGGCGTNVEGFWGASAQAIVTKIQSNYGTLKYLAMDEPFYFANMYNGPGACHWSPQQIAANAASALNILKAAFPGLVVGDIELVPVNDTLDWLQRYAAWMDSFEAMIGSKLAFFHCDTGFQPMWARDVASLRVESSKRGIALGIIYNGLGNDLSDFAWLSHAQQNFTDFELHYGQPDQAIFQSWMAYPMKSLPEMTPYTFTWLIDQYTRSRPSLSVTHNLTEATGKLVDSSGRGIGSAPITVAFQPTAGPGIVSTYTLIGTVPSSSTDAIFQTWVPGGTGYFGCGTQHSNDMSVYSFQYTDASHQMSLGFANGLSDWDLDPTATASMQLGSDSNGAFLHISTTPAQETWVNSPPFAVTAGTMYDLTVQARISAGSVGSCYFRLVFFTGTTYVSTSTLLYGPATFTLSPTQTDNDGSYFFHFAPLGQGTFQVQAFYPGIDYPLMNASWPALVTESLKILDKWLKGAPSEASY